MAENGISYIVVDDVPLERFKNFVMPPMPAKEVILLLAREGEDALSPDTAAEVRKLLINELMPENPKADRAEIEAFVDGAVSEVRAVLRG